jgi:single-strand DNA-binding protein
MASFDLNKIMLIGNAGKLPEFKEFANGNGVVKFTLATNDGWKDKTSGEYVTKTYWHNIVCYNTFVGKAIMNNVKVGTKVYVEGESQSRRYEKDGSDQWITEVVIPKFGGDMKVLVRTVDGSLDAPAGTATPGAPYDDAVPF